MALTIEVTATIKHGRKKIGSVTEKSENIKIKSVDTIPWHVLLLAKRLVEGAFAALEVEDEIQAEAEVDKT
jgi:hypothetical protein